MTTKLLFRNFVSELRADIASTKMVPVLSAGLTSGLSLLIVQIAFGSFIFSGELEHYSSLGVGLVLFGNFASCLIFALACGYRGSIAGLSPVLAIVMASIASTTDAPSERLFITVTVTLIISAIVTGLCCLVIGRFRLANLLRFIPYPVVSGFVAGIGGMVCLAAMTISGTELNWRDISASLEPSVLFKWAPGMVFGAAIYFAIKRWGNPLILPVSVTVAVVAFHLALIAFNISGDEARTAGMLLLSTTEENIWPSIWPSDLAHVDWTAIIGQMPNLLTLVLIAFICIVMNIAGLELVVNQQLDWDREFRVTGIASMVSGLGGGTVSTLIIPASLRNKLLRADTRLTGVIAAAVIGGALFLGDDLLNYIPTALAGGILFFTGLGMIDEGLVKSRKRLPLSEYNIILLIFLVVIVVGLVEGVAAGMLLTLVFFALRLSRVDPIEDRFSARERHSNRDRSVPDRAILLAEGDRVQAYRLRGYIFFGSITPLVEQLKKSLTNPNPCLLLDFTAVSGFDFSAVTALSKFLQKSNADGVQLVLSGLSETLRLGLERNLPPKVFATLQIELDTDLGLERCEDIIISEWKADATMATTLRGKLLDSSADDLEYHLARQIQFEELIEELGHWLTPREYSAQEILASEDTSQDGLQFLLSGRASVYDGVGARLRQFSPGDAIWPASQLDNKANLVIAEESCQTMVLTPTNRYWLEEHEERLALKIYRYLLAQRFEARPKAD